MLTIRFAGAEDAEAIEAARAASWRAGYAGLLPRAVIDDLTGPDEVERRRRWPEANPHGRMLLAEVDGVPAGMAAFGPERRPRDTSASSRVELYSLYVAPEFWSDGVGRALLERVVDESRASGYDRLVLWVLDTNTRARRFYARAGLTETAREETELRGHVVTHLRCERDLTRPPRVSGDPGREDT
ncbi:GNAT family N-acetyltransferase [Actinomadura sp. NEAU-AAG7]|uniref:GNAT family N-acetyltransferase n=1 Tax=Actinomadura sp. NEAU-AAG7 TaxID=2839640 RepID=UPI001BE43588|nr:GNAT family N-acetyltransferase [Actinomadura sp. NEAU-AAG7]MBT2209375.1 GNAT family N-acetyltransferase [Actinomadura sp. NEAU-AAG7]